MKIFLNIVLIFSTMILFFIPNYAAVAKVEVGKTTVVRTNVEAKFEANTSRSIIAGAQLYFNEKIETDEKGKAQIIFMDGTSLLIGPNSQLIIDKFIYNPNENTGAMTLSLARGVVRFVGGRISKNNKVTVNTPVGSIGIRGGIAMIDQKLNGGMEADFVFGKSMSVTAQNVTQVTTRPGRVIRITDVNLPPLAPVIRNQSTLSAKLKVFEAQENEVESTEAQEKEVQVTNQETATSEGASVSNDSSEEKKEAPTNETASAQTESPQNESQTADQGSGSSEASNTQNGSVEGSRASEPKGAPVVEMQDQNIEPSGRPVSPRGPNFASTESSPEPATSIKGIIIVPENMFKGAPPIFIPPTNPVQIPREPPAASFILQTDEDDGAGKVFEDPTQGGKIVAEIFKLGTEGSSLKSEFLEFVPPDQLGPILGELEPERAAVVFAEIFKPGAADSSLKSEFLEFVPPDQLGPILDELEPVELNAVAGELAKPNPILAENRRVFNENEPNSTLIFNPDGTIAPNPNRVEVFNPDGTVAASPKGTLALNPVDKAEPAPVDEVAPNPDPRMASNPDEEVEQATLRRTPTAVPHRAAIIIFDGKIGVRESVTGSFRAISNNDLIGLESCFKCRALQNRIAKFNNMKSGTEANNSDNAHWMTYIKSTTANLSAAVGKKASYAGDVFGLATNLREKNRPVKGTFNANVAFNRHSYKVNKFEFDLDGANFEYKNYGKTTKNKDNFDIKVQTGTRRLLANGYFIGKKTTSGIPPLGIGGDFVVTGKNYTAGGIFVGKRPQGNIDNSN